MIQNIFGGKTPPLMTFFFSFSFPDLENLVKNEMKLVNNSGSHGRCWNGLSSQEGKLSLYDPAGTSAPLEEMQTRDESFSGIRCDRNRLNMLKSERLYIEKNTAAIDWSHFTDPLVTSCIDLKGNLSCRDFIRLLSALSSLGVLRGSYFLHQPQRNMTCAFQNGKYPFITGCPLWLGFQGQ